MNAVPADQAQIFPQGPPAGERSALELVNAVLAHRRLVFVLPIMLALVVGIANLLLRDRVYTAHSSFLPVSPEALPSGMSGLTSQLGIAIAGNRQGESPAFYVELLESRELLLSAAGRQYTVRTEEGTRTASLFELLDVKGPPRARAEAAVATLRGAIDAEQARESGIIRLQVSAPFPELAADVNRVLLELLVQFNLDRRQSQAAAERRFLEERVNQVEGEVLSAERSLEEFLRRNRTFEHSPELTFEHQRLQWEVSNRRQLLTSLFESRERARVEEVRNTPAVTVLDAPMEPSRPEGRGTVLLSLGVLVGTMAAAVVLALILEAPRLAGIEQRQALEDFRRLRQDAADDVRQLVKKLDPRTWVRSARR